MVEQHLDGYIVELECCIICLFRILDNVVLYTPLMEMTIWGISSATIILVQCSTTHVFSFYGGYGIYQQEGIPDLCCLKNP